MNFCSQCGAPVEQCIPPGENIPRFVCTACKKIHYLNPRIITGCIPLKDKQILLCRRAIEPKKGLWTIPSGFMENGETLEDGALRETKEEANADVKILNLHCVYSIPHISQVYIIFLARLNNLDFHPGAESLETRLFSREEIPWDSMAFVSVTFSLKKYFENPDPKASLTYVGRHLFQPAPQSG